MQGQDHATPWTVGSVLGAHVLVARREERDRKEALKKKIEESKYLGGDVQHTHLVKGLDPVLLQKVA